MHPTALKFVGAFATLVVGTCSLAHAVDAAADKRGAQAAPSWSSPSLRGETVVGPNGAVTTDAALLANDKWGIGDAKTDRARPLLSKSEEEVAGPLLAVMQSYA